MKKLLTLILLAASFTMASAQETQVRDVGHFTGIKVAEGVDVYVKKGDKESVKVEVTGTAASNVLTEVSGSYLKVHMRDGNYRGNIDARVYVTYTQLEKLSASSGGSIFSEGVIKSNELEISTSSAGNIEVSVDAGNIEVSASSAGEVELQGTAKSLSADASSAGQIDSYDLQAQDVSVEASSGGSAKVHVTNNLVGNASSGGSIRYRGNPTKSVTNSSSGGSVKKSS
jgi:formylmethanofuran dehydrogenase subunit C